MFHREGFKIIAITFIIVGAMALTADAYITNHLIKYGVQGVALTILVLILQFFRNPKRAVQFNLNEIIAPVDGKVVVIEEVEEKEYFQGKRKQVSIFMSPLNVHVTRYPASGVIQYSKYHPGKYLVAWHPKASEENERTTIVIKTPKFGDILYRQIAGALARRIVNYAKKRGQSHSRSRRRFYKIWIQSRPFPTPRLYCYCRSESKSCGGKNCHSNTKRWR